MEFKKLCDIRKRICEKYPCDRCPIAFNYKKDYILNCCEYFLNNPEQAEQIVEKWEKEHPVVTNGDKFRKVFGVELKSSERYDGYCLLTGNDGISKDSEEWLNREYKESEVDK